MPPSNQQLQWSEIRQFGGLHRSLGPNPELAAPANSASIMRGCYPQPEGGLRPFFKVAETIGTTGLNAADVGLSLLPMPVANEAIGGSQVETVDFVLITDQIGRTNFRAYVLRRMLGETSWTQCSAADFNDDDTVWASFARRPFLVHHGVGSTPHDIVRKVFATIGGITPGDGLYEIKPYGSGGTTTPVVTAVTDWSPGSNHLVGPLSTHQSRLVTADGEALVFSNPGADDVKPGSMDTRFIIPNTEGTNYLATSSGSPAPLPLSLSTTIAWVAPIPPSDFLVCTRDGKLFNIQGDFADPSIRDLGQWGPAVIQQPAVTPFGVVVMYPSDGVYLITPDGGREFLSEGLNKDMFSWLTMQQDSADRMGFGATAHSNGFVFCPNPIGNPLVYDTRTKAWFESQSLLEHSLGGARFIVADTGTTAPGVWIIRSGRADVSSTLLYRIIPGDTLPTSGGSDIATRNKRWEWQSQPLRANDNRELELREINLSMNARSSGATVTVNVTSDRDAFGVTQTVNLSSGNNLVRLQYRVRGEYLRINVKGTDLTTNAHAPSLESIRWGTRPGHLL